MTAGLISIEYGMNGPNYSVVTACASANHSIGLGYKHIKDNEADIMVVGGSESTINPLTIAGFNNARALSTRNDEPEKASHTTEPDCKLAVFKTSSFPTFINRYH